MFETAAPRWSAPVLQGAAMFPERYTRDGIADRCDHRLFVQARHIYSFCAFGELGWDGPWRERCNAAVDHLIAVGRRPDGFYIHKFSCEGAVADARADFYDQAFTLFMFAHAGRTLERPELFDHARALFAAMERDWRDPRGGFREGEIAECPPRRQNPHMHLFEAAQALYDATRDDRWNGLATEMADLCARRFIDPETGALLEYFTETLDRLDSREGMIVEPGHCFEWAWLFERLEARGLGGAATSDGLVAFARAKGIDSARGVAINEVYTDGNIRWASARLWPQTERLKAAVARYRRTGEEVELREACAAFSGLARYFDPSDRGIWFDKLRPDGGFEPENAPGSSLYHITCSYVELLSLFPGLGRAR
ncbi:AGE family epimerase/isomerase [Methyloraptor flagellatus]|uniref:AGE family epimerase/isomerase n=1 Tax=Methyloraptor flagellatus TaxID=3162530 RepID=A0AAU7X9F3_9HYPH